MTVTAHPGSLIDDIAAVNRLLRGLLEALDPDAVGVPDSPRLWCGFVEAERLSIAGMTLLARRVEETNTWKDAGFRSAAEQMASVSGLSVHAARTMLETSKELEALPATADAMRAGDLSAPKATAIASAATIAPEAEAGLLRSAEATPVAEIREKCLQAKAVDRDAAHERIRRGRSLREWVDGEGAWNLHARGTPEAGARFRAAHARIVDELFNTARTEDHRESRDAHAFDALIALAERAGGPVEGDSASPKKSRSFTALIRVDIEALRRGAVESDEICDIPGLGPIPLGVARELLGDAVLKLVITKGVDVVNVTHLGRSPTIAQRVALCWQSPACTVEGCTRTRLENDHRDDWADTHQTRLDGLDPLCDHHHDLKTYEGWALIAGKGPRPMVPPDDPRHPKNRPPPDP